jgi:hypothetical protein
MQWIAIGSFAAAALFFLYALRRSFGSLRVGDGAHLQSKAKSKPEKRRVHQQQRGSYQHVQLEDSELGERGKNHSVKPTASSSIHRVEL